MDGLLFLMHSVLNLSFNACSVHKTQHHQLLAYQSQPVNATPGSRDQMETHARSAAQARINRAWDPLLVKAVPLIQSLHLAVSQTPTVSATPATRGKTEAHA